MNMKTQILILLSAVFFMHGAFAEETFQVKTQSSRWKKTNNAYTLQQLEKGADRLVILFTPKANAWYRFDWTTRCSDATRSAKMGVRIERNGKKGRFQFPASTKWIERSLFFSVQDTNWIKIDITPLECKAGIFQVQDCKITELDQNPFSVKLISGSEDGAADSLYRYCQKTTGAKIVPTNAFLAGKNALELNAGGKAEILFQTVPFPVQRGKEYQLKFWAQSDSLNAMAMNISSWSPWGHSGKHFYKRETIKLGSECQEFSLLVKIPDDFSASPDLQDGASVIFESIKGENGKILLSDISFAEVK